ncbi:MAG: division/cell wall cluster transcriptional repressor MraZ [Candidatus Spechtbacteria bacterium]|nr:division/cell wall cluster transcriptional repressor MraZ [Candidatus Spechtbacteria bacterium]
MFIGEYAHTVDDKKRLAIPAKFRAELGKKAVITRGLDNCLFIYPQKEWNTLAQKLGKLPFGQSDTRGFLRLMLAGAMQADIDGLGRILVPDYLKQYAELDKQVVVTGLYNHLEIWDEKKWAEYKERTEKEVGNIAERLGGLGV